MAASYGGVAFVAFLFVDTRWETTGALLWWAFIVTPAAHFRFGAKCFQEALFLVSNAALILLVSFALIRRQGTVFLGAAIYLTSNIIESASGSGGRIGGVGEREKFGNENLRTRKLVCYTKAAAELVLCAAIKAII